MARHGLWALGLVALAAGCGGRTVHRPLELFVGGLSGRAAKLVVLVFPGETQRCAGVRPADAPGMSAPVRAEWRRAESMERGLALEAVDDDRITLMAYSEDADGRVIQFACQEIEYADLESPDLSIQLVASE